MGLHSWPFLPTRHTMIASTNSHNVKHPSRARTQVTLQVSLLEPLEIIIARSLNNTVLPFIVRRAMLMIFFVNLGANRTFDKLSSFPLSVVTRFTVLLKVATTLVPSPMTTVLLFSRLSTTLDPCRCVPMLHCWSTTGFLFWSCYCWLQQHNLHRDFQHDECHQTCSGEQSGFPASVLLHNILGLNAPFSYI